jgi:hypothetical protein
MRPWWLREGNWMDRVFGVGTLVDVPVRGRRTLVLTALVDIDLATEAAARAEITAPDPGAPDGLVLDLSGVFVGVAAIRCIRDATERGSALAVVGAPRWLPGFAALVGGAAPAFVRTVREGVAVLRTAERAASSIPAARRRRPAVHAARCTAPRVAGP